MSDDVREELPPPTGVRPGGPDSGTEHELLSVLEDEIEQSTLWGEAWKTLRRNPMFIIGGVVAVLMTLVAVFPGLFAGGVDPRDCDLTVARQWPSAAHWFGTDLQGCDYYANVIYGARISLAIGLLSVTGTMVLATILGTTAGYFGGLTDSLLSRFTDILYGVPLLLGAMILLTVTEQRSVFTVALALSIFGWMTAMRLVRSSVITVGNADFVAAAQAVAASTSQILVRQDAGASVNPRWPIGQAIAEPLQLHTDLDQSARDARVTELLDRVHLSRAMRNRFPHQLSGGQRQRVGIARALALQPSLLIVDEPTSALDVSVQEKVLELFAELQDEFGFACLFITHDLAVVEHVADRIAVLRHGKLVEADTTSQVLLKPRDAYTRRLIAAVPVPDPKQQAARRQQRRALLGEAS